MPILEAMALGVPVITSKVSSMPEIAGKAALFVDPSNVDQLVRAMADVLTKPAVAKRLAEAGPEQAKQFSWDTCATETMEVYKKVIGKK